MSTFLIEELNRSKFSKDAHPLLQEEEVHTRLVASTFFVYLTNQFQVDDVNL